MDEGGKTCPEQPAREPERKLHMLEITFADGRGMGDEELGHS